MAGLGRVRHQLRHRPEDPLPGSHLGAGLRREALQRRALGDDRLLPAAVPGRLPAHRLQLGGLGQLGLVRQVRRGDAALQAHRDAPELRRPQVPFGRGRGDHQLHAHLPRRHTLHLARLGRVGRVLGDVRQGAEEPGPLPQGSVGGDHTRRSAFHAGNAQAGLREEVREPRLPDALPPVQPHPGAPDVLHRRLHDPLRGGGRDPELRPEPGAALRAEPRRRAHGALQVPRVHGGAERHDRDGRRVPGRQRRLTGARAEASLREPRGRTARCHL
mmetsp:Transcript_42916/g.113641  ORF Transcript_42916/g.113641 Transcript_42916/m.113641 type:complete len:273 (+) Transcript_42916:4295-5113(+)